MRKSPAGEVPVEACKVAVGGAVGDVAVRPYEVMRGGARPDDTQALVRLAACVVERSGPRFARQPVHHDARAPQLVESGISGGPRVRRPGEQQLEPCRYEDLVEGGRRSPVWRHRRVGEPIAGPSAMP